MASSGPSSGPAPFSWPPSQYWDDLNGPWSSFALRVGDPEQVVRVLVSTAGQATWVVLPTGCGDGCDDPNSRGGAFNVTKSMTWNSTGIFPLGLELNLNYGDTGAYGLDTVALGYSDSIGGPPLDSQVVVGMEAYSYYIGMFGLGPQPTNLTDFSKPYPSFLSTLKSRNMIPSLSWGYTAGAHYRHKGVYGSLTLGGYDRSRLIHNDVSFHLAPDQSRDLVVFLHSIISKKSNGFTESLLPYSILIFLDSTLPYMYLPREACEKFEQNFGLIWDSSMGMYTVDEKLHNSLTLSNPSFTFTVGDSKNGPTVDIVLPYASFDLLASYPFVPNTTRYFPLLRAENETQYTLGRAFLQEAYLVTNYEHSNFSIFQAKFEEGLDKDIVPIPARSSSLTQSVTNVTTSPTSAPPSSRNRALGVGLGLGLGILAILISTLLVLISIRKRRTASRMEEIGNVTQPSASIDDLHKSPIIILQEVEDTGLSEYKEMPDSGKVELPTGPSPASELPGSSPNIPFASTRHPSLARNPSSNSFARRRFAICFSAGSMMKTWMKQIGTSASNDTNTCNDLRTSSSSTRKPPDLNRALPPTPDLENEHNIMDMMNILLATQEGSKEIAASYIDGESLKSQDYFF